MVFFISYLRLAILLFGAAFHYYWGFGGRVGCEASPLRRSTSERLFEPPWWDGHLVGAVLVVACWLVLAAAHISSFPSPITWARGAVTLMGAGFIIRSVWATRYGKFFKAHRNSAFARYDTRLHSPFFIWHWGWGFCMSSSRPKKAAPEELAYASLRRFSR